MEKLDHAQPRDWTVERGTWSRRIVLGIVLPLVALAVVAHPSCAAKPQTESGEVSEPDSRSTVFTTMGVEGVYYIRADGSQLHVKPADADAPLVVRIVDAVVEEDTTVHELRYIASQPGNYDLRNYVVGGDGQAVSQLLPAHIAIRELLMPDHDGSLWQLPGPKIVPPLRYKLVLTLMATIWMIPLVWMFLRRVSSLPSASSARASLKPTLVEQ